MGKVYVPEGETALSSQIGATFEALAATIAARRDAEGESYTHRLLSGPVDDVLKKVVEEAGEVALAGKDADAAARSAATCPPMRDSGGVDALGDARSEAQPAGDAAIDHLRYEAADVIYHLLVVLERFSIPLDELAAELNSRMSPSERPCGSVLLRPEHVKRGK